MNTDPIGTRVAALVGGVTAQDVDPDTDGDRSLRDLGVSSLRMIELIGTIESAFGFRIGDEEIDEDHFGTFSGLVRFVAGKIRS